MLCPEFNSVKAPLTALTKKAYWTTEAQRAFLEFKLYAPVFHMPDPLSPVIVDASESPSNCFFSDHLTHTEYSYDVGNHKLQ